MDQLDLNVPASRYVGMFMYHYCIFGVAGSDNFNCNEKTFIYLRATRFLDEDWEPELHWITKLIKLLLLCKGTNNN